MREQISRSPADPYQGANSPARNLLAFVVLLLLLGLPFTALSNAARTTPSVMQTKGSVLKMIPWPADGLHFVRNLGVERADQRVW